MASEKTTLEKINSRKIAGAKMVCAKTDTKSTFSSVQIEQFRSFIWDFYSTNKRSFAWRNCQDPYKILVSEIMLQQTQTHRVQEKYEQFISAFPSFDMLAQHSLHDALSVWQGLGYNRRGKYLHETAQQVMREHAGVLPNCPVALEALPGIGANTAGSICAFAFNNPTVFIETNIRAVFINSFFKERVGVSDAEILPLVAATVDQDNPREWYYALMDYGVYLKKMLPNPSRKSKHHTKQSKFEGSDRQIRGAIIRALTKKKSERLDILLAAVCAETHADLARAQRILDGLVQEKFLVREALNQEYAQDQGREYIRIS
jgi:A/G-specific adenine glycosylase